MKMETTVTVLSVNHYDMGENKGVNVRIVGSEESTNNKFGLSIVEATVLNYNELTYLRSLASHLPAKFKANLQIISKKLANSKEAGTIALSDLNFLNPVQFVDVMPGDQKVAK